MKAPRLPDAAVVLAVLAAALLVPVQADVVSRSATGAVDRVLEMLQGLQEEIVKEGTEAEKVFDETKRLCSTRSRELRYSYEDSKGDKERCEADIAQATVEIDTLTSKIEDLAMSISSDESDIQEAETIRKDEAAVFEKAERGVAGTVDALDSALAIVGHEQRKVYKSEALVQMEQGGDAVAQALAAVVEASAISTADHERLTALLQSSQSAGSQSEEEAEDAALDAALGVQPAVTAYSSHSGGLVEVLNEVLEKAQSQLEELRKEERKKQQDHEIMMSSIKDKIKYKQRDLDRSKQEKITATKNKAAAEGDLAIHLKSMQEDESSLQDLQNSCIKKASEFEEDTKARTDEVAALGEASKMISSKLGGGNPSFLQVARNSHSEAEEVSASLGDDRTAAAAAAARSVRRLAVRMDSPVLIELAGRLDYAAKGRKFGAGDPFKKVRGLIEDMIGSLQQQAQAEAEHEAFCKTEMGITEVKSQDRQDDVERLKTVIDQSKSEVARLAEEMATLRQELSDLATTQKEMDEVRAGEKALHNKAVKENKDAIEGLKLALQSLRVYYAKMGDGVGRGKRIVGLLEYTQSDMHMRVTMLEAEEKEAVAEYQQLTKENEISRATKQQNVDHHTKETTDLQKVISEAESDHATAKEELDALQDYMEKLKEQCIAKPEPYEERKARRAKEIQGLREALGALDGSSQLQVQEQSRSSINTVFLQLRGSPGP
eukprot:gb/GFBE01069048.1/.p1 GENE.gb/GFBE01069048.1/~~gb/GFBE01069048.1/.p1  ORF type:complete len:719 (+),score=243.99 gb/GFBE01069048.1/:1-2157(+)